LRPTRFTGCESWLRIVCSNDDKTAAEREITRAVATRPLVMRELRAEPIEATENTIVLAILESSTGDPVMMNELAEEIRGLPCTESVDWTASESES
jgi:hypothetical protein